MASGVYLSMTRVPGAGGTDNDNQVFSNVSSTPAVFSLRGGTYGFSAIGTFVSCTLNVLAADGSTYVAVGGGGTLSAAGYGSVTIPQGTYKIVIA